MRQYEYYSGGTLRAIEILSVPQAMARARSKRWPRPSRTDPIRPQQASDRLMGTIQAQSRRFDTRFQEVSEESTYLVPAKPARATVIPTETVAVDGARASELRWARSKHGMEVIAEGLHGKVLLGWPGGTENPITDVFTVARELYERQRVGAAHPNFLRAVQRPTPSSKEATIQWALDNPGNIDDWMGKCNADVHAVAAWAATKKYTPEGSPGARVAILDEGVDTLHPYLRSAVVAERDFVEGRDNARPSGDDAHGTACAGIIFSRHKTVRGLAPGLGLVAARIAKSNSQGFWIFDDWSTADAIDWCWDDARADVLSNSWGGGPPVDIIVRAFDRARTLGRGRKGTVIVAAAGNSQSPVDFPGNSPGVLTVGASNQWDERKTRGSKDGEDWWGSNYGDSLDLLAPGVQILTTDIHGSRGSTGGMFEPHFNGTSAAAPFVAAVAGLMISINRDLDEGRIRSLINQTVDPLGKSDWNRYEGHGRLNAYAALRAARCR